MSDNAVALAGAFMAGLPVADLIAATGLDATEEQFADAYLRAIHRLKSDQLMRISHVIYAWDRPDERPRSIAQELTRAEFVRRQFAC